MVSTSFVIPVFNEMHFIENSIKKLLEIIPTNSDFEIIIVNDGSTDDTLSIVKTISKSHDKVRFLSYHKNRGRGYAIRKGFSESAGDNVVYIDADLSINPRIIKKILKQLRGNEIVIGSKHLNASIVEYPFFRRLLSKVYSKLVSFVMGVKVSDFQCGLKGFRKKRVMSLMEEVVNEGWSWDTEVLCLAYRKGYSIKELPVIVRNVYERESKVKVWRDSFLMASDLIKIWVNHGLK